MKDNPNTISAAIRSAGKLLLQCRRPSMPVVEGEEASRGIIILGNGPSLRETVDKNLDTLKAWPTMAVNYFALTPEMDMVRPRYYILVDPLFFSKPQPERVKQLCQALERVSWPICLLLPHAAGNVIRLENPNIVVARYNAIGVEAPGLLRDMVYDRAWGMPRPHNVLIPAIMTAAYMGFRKIWLVGADHSWPRTVAVDIDNHVLPNQPHFYAADPAEESRVNAAYTQRRLWQLLASWTVVFRGYLDIERWAKRRGISIYNATPASLIDAFPRAALPSPEDH